MSISCNFCHNVISQKISQLVKTISTNLKCFPDAHVYVVFFGDLDYEPLSKPNVFWRYGGPKLPHKIGSYNGMIKATRFLCENEESGFGIFTHEDVKIVYAEKVKKTIQKTKLFTVRVPKKVPYNYHDDYFMFDTLIFRVNKLSRAIFEDCLELESSEDKLPKDFRGSPCPERKFGSSLPDNTPVNKIEYTGETWGIQSHGFYHEPGRIG